MRPSAEVSFAFDHIMREGMVTFDKNKDSRLNNGVIPQVRSLKYILLLFIEPYIAGARDSEKYINLSIIKVSVTVKGSPHKKIHQRHGSAAYVTGDQPVLSAQRCRKQNVPHKVLPNQVWVVHRHSVHVRHHSARKRRPSCEHQRPCVP